MCKEVDKITNSTWGNAIAKRKLSRSFVMYDIFELIMCPTHVNHVLPFNTKITEVIVNREAITLLDATKKDSNVADHWILTNNERQYKLKSTICHKNWSNNTIVGAETITLLESFQALHRKGKHIWNGLVKIGFNNRREHK